MSEPQSQRDLTSGLAFTSGDRLGKFTIQRYIARGGMGEVYKAWDNDLHRSVALKTLLSTFGAFTAKVHGYVRYLIPRLRAPLNYGSPNIRVGVKLAS